MLLTSLTTAISEEIFFRGFLMGYIEYQLNIYWGLLISSILFGIAHLTNGSYNFQDTILIIIGIFIAGLFYGLLTLFYKTIWSSIILHFLFDSTQLFDITTKQSNQGIIEYVYVSSYKIITGGGYGSTVSIITVASFLILILLLLSKMKLESIRNE
ncbi:CPBP family intramembrane glutamic endopeptidase [Staphylococcus caeli]|nr:CPBP family intramembrane glutamic endopeptidase [Staphylococcus caeli]